MCEEERWTGGEGVLNDIAQRQIQTEEFRLGLWSAYTSRKAPKGVGKEVCTIIAVHQSRWRRTNEDRQVLFLWRNAGQGGGTDCRIQNRSDNPDGGVPGRFEYIPSQAEECGMVSIKCRMN